MLSLPKPPVHGAGDRGPLPVFRWRGGCGRWDPSPTPQRALLQAGVARCWGGTWAPGGGAPLALVWRVRGWALSLPEPPVVGARSRGPLPVFCWRPGSRASCELAFAGGAGGGRRGEGAPLAWVWGVWTRAFSLPKPPVHWVGARGAVPVFCRRAGCGRVELSPTPQGSSELPLCAVGAARGCPEGASCLGVGRPGWGAFPPVAARQRGSLPGPAACFPWARQLRA